MKFGHLFSPIKLGPVEVKNRIVMSSHETGFGFFQRNLPADRYIEYMRARAEGGCGLIVIGACPVHPSNLIFGNEPLLPPDELLPRLRRMSETLHEHGTKVFIQLFHHGKEWDSTQNLTPLESFSDIPSFSTRERPMVLTQKEIGDIIECFTVFARTAREAGLDGVELHGTHGYLIQQSWSPWGNQRKDKYGEPMRFAFELIDRVRQEIGPEMALGFRISGDDLHPGGMDNEKMQEVARTLEATGKVNYINCSAGSQFAHYGLVIGPGYIPLGFFIPFHSAIRRAVEKIPVFASVRINDPVQAEKILEDGHADLVVMTRAQIADPEISKKAQAGKLDEIRHCIACVQGCIGRGFRLKSITCTQNPRVGREAETTFAPARKQKKVVVVGGGPAGMEAARTAAERGHQVVLFEKEKNLGGQVNIITRIPERDEFNEIIRWRRFQLDKLGVKIVLGKEADERVILGESPDAVVLATGSLPTKPEFPGGDLLNVHHLVQVLWENVPLGEHVVIVDTVFKQQAVTLADHLAGMEKKVTLVTPLPYPGMFLGITEIPIMFMRMLTKGVTFIESSEALEFTGDTLVVRNNFTQLTQNIEKIDSLIVIQANRQNDGLFWKLMDKIPEIYRIGDCASPRDVLQAIREGFDVGRKI